VRELRQLAQLGRHPFELIVADLEHGLGQIYDPLDSNLALRDARAVAACRFLLAVT
jgi:hypothetical protein